MVITKAADARDWIHLNAWSFPCVVGIYEQEFERPQAVRVELSMNLDLEAAAGEDLSASVSYAHVLEEVEFIAQRGHWLLLESMAHAIATHVLAASPLAARAPVQEIVLRLSKPDIFGGRAIPSVEVRRPLRWLSPSRRTFRLGALDCTIVHETAHSGAYHLVLPEGGTLALPSFVHGLLLKGAARVGASQRAARDKLAAGETCVGIDRAGTAVLLAATQPWSRHL